MGRWAQRRHGSGGGGSGAAPILIAEANITDALLGTAQLLFSGDIDAAEFVGTNFQTLPNAIAGNTVNQLASDTLEVIFDSALTLETDVEYSGAAPNVTTPQTVPFT